MIDIHSHIIFGVDDGAKDINESIAIIKEEINQGVTDIICTPHYREGMFETSNELIDANFNILKEEVKNQNLPINLHLGREIYYRKNVYDLIKNSELKGINGTKYLLVEFSYTKDPEIDEVAYKLNRMGYTMVVAHIERYEYIKDLNLLYDLRGLGSYIQVNASTICGKDGLKQKLKVMKYIKNDLIDFVASDIHFSRTNYIEKAYNIIKKKFGIETADKLFKLNQKIFFEEVNNG